MSVKYYLAALAVLSLIKKKKKKSKFLNKTIQIIQMSVGTRLTLISEHFAW